MLAGSLFSGIGGFDLALERAGIEVAWQVEVDDACHRVLSRHWPSVARYRDVRVVGAELAAIDVLVGGFPCQDVSVAGRRAGLAGERSGLWFEFHRLAGQLRPRWVVVENVPGLLSSNGGRDFGVIVEGLVELGYGVAWRVLDAQYFGVAQRRRRVFVVGCLGDPTRAAQVLLEPESCGGHPAPSREARARVAGTLAGGPTGPRGPGHGARSGQAKDDNLVNALTRHHGRNDPSEETFVPTVTPCLPAYGGPRGTTNNPQFDDHAVVVGALTGNKDRGGWRAGPDEAAAGHVIAHALRAEGADASEDGTGRGTPLVTVVEPLDASYAKTTDSAGSNGAGPRNVVIGYDQHNGLTTGAIAPTMTSAADRINRGPAVAFQERGRGDGRSLDTQDELAYSLLSPGDGGRAHERNVQHGLSVRRLTPTECERLQGFPDGWTEGESDSARYRMLGNAVCVPVVEWIVGRIVESLR